MKDIIFAMALRNVKINYLRSVLAAVGITIGIISIASMGMLGTNMTGSVKDQLSGMANKLSVNAYTGKGGGGGFGPSSSDNLTKAQYQNIKKIASKFGYVYGLHSIRDKVKKGKDSWNTNVYGIEISTMKTVLNNLTSGGYPSSDNSVLIGPTFASDNGFQVGSQFTLGSKGVKVAGIIETRGFTIDMNTDNAVVVTKSLFESMYGAKDEFNEANIVLDNIDDLSTAETAITSQMNRREQTVRIQESSRIASSI